MADVHHPRLAGRRAIITGAASGIGLATAKLFAEHGCRIVVVDLPGSELASHFADTAGILALELDITAEDAPRRIVEMARQSFGGLDILVNNAGICIGAGFEETTEDVWRRIFAVNVDSVFRLSQAALGELKKSTCAAVINLGSIMSDMAGPGLCAYGASKHAVAGLTKAMAVDLGPARIRVNYLQPGSIVTGLSRPFLADPEFRRFWENKAPLGRLGEAEDVARAALFLASDDAGFVSGAGLAVDGGAIVKF